MEASVAMCRYIRRNGAPTCITEGSENLSANSVQRKHRLDSWKHIMLVGRLFFLCFIDNVSQRSTHRTFSMALGVHKESYSRCY